MNNKSAFEIRASLLDLAFCILKEKAAANAAENASSGGGSHYITTAPTTEEVIAEATKLNDFVSTKAQ